MDDLLAQFIVEARELVQTAIDDVLALSCDVGNFGRLGGAFRAVHTLKGSAGLFDMPVLQGVLHRAESYLDKVRSGTEALDEDLINWLIAVLEWVDLCVDDIERQGSVTQTRLDAARQFDDAVTVATFADTDPKGAESATTPAWVKALAMHAHDTCTVALRYSPHPECFFNGDDPIAILSRVPLIRHVSISLRDPVPTLGLYDTFRSNLVFETLSSAPIVDVGAVFRLIPDQVELVPLNVCAAASGPSDTLDQSKSEARRMLRIDATHLDVMLSTMGELVTVTNSVGDLVTAAHRLEGGGDLARAVAATQKQLDRLVGTLYDDVLQTRMVALGQIFVRLPRLVRDLSQRLGKPTELIIIGDDIKADKSIADLLFEPLLHLIRNAMDHGIEAPADRVALRKPKAAKLTLQVTQQREQIAISLADDGRGIDPLAIRESAARKQLVSSEDLATLDDLAVLDLLFLPGFSTAAAVSDLSGRGVGLDAVRASILRLGGTVQIESAVGEGATFTLRIPASFSMTPLLLVAIAGERYGVPLRTVVETVRIARGDLMSVRESLAFLLRDRVVPVLFLTELLGMPSSTWPTENLTIAVLKLGSDHVGIVVDSIADKAELVTKPLNGLLTGAKGIAGTTVLGDGRILFVLDMAELVQ